MTGLTSKTSQPYIIVQAGGRGSRLRHITWNKPKCLAPVNGKPILYHLFDAFPGSKFIIIGDYLFSVLEKYLQVNEPSVEYQLVKTNEKGTVAGINSALALLADHDDFYICWSDLFFDQEQNNGTNIGSCVVFTTDDFICRWSSVENKLEERTSSENGIAGLFYFRNKKLLDGLPNGGEFVRWLSNSVLNFSFSKLRGVSELGEFSEINLRNEKFVHHRFFNDVQIQDDVVVKRAVLSEYEQLNKDEINWYDHVSNLKFEYIPEVHSVKPLTMSRVNGKHPFDFESLTLREASSIVNNSLITLKSLHRLGATPTKNEDVIQMYLSKTIDRIAGVSKLIPMWDKKSITINGKKCKNWFGELFIDEIVSLISFEVDEFKLIHGDPTFSNTLVNDNLQCYFIDPRGSFGSTKIYGDPLYDYAKVFYSAYGNYDSFNRKQFKVYVDEYSFEIMLEDSKFKDISLNVFKDHFPKLHERIRLLHSLIWASLTGYAKDDVDSIIGAYCLATLHLEEIMNDI